MEDSQKVDDTVQRGFVGNNAEGLSLNFMHSKSPFPVDSGVIGGVVDTEGVSQTFLLTKLSLGGRLDSQPPRRADNPLFGSPSLKKMSQATTSPVTPLDLPGRRFNLSRR